MRIILRFIIEHFEVLQYLNYDFSNNTKEFFFQRSMFIFFNEPLTENFPKSCLTTYLAHCNSVIRVADPGVLVRSGSVFKDRLDPV